MINTKPTAINLRRGQMIVVNACFTLLPEGPRFM